MPKLRRHSFLFVLVIIVVISAVVGLFLSRADEVEHYLRTGQEYLNGGNRDAAVAEFTRAIETDAQNPMGYFYRGITRLDKYFTSFEQPDDFRSAIADLNRAIELDPNYVDAYYYRGLAKNYSGEHHQVIENLTFVIEHSPDMYPTAYMVRGIAHYFLMDSDAALTDLSHAIQLDASLPEAYLYLGNIQFARNEDREALESYQQYLDLIGENADITIVGRVERLSTQLSRTPTPGT